MTIPAIPGLQRPIAVTPTAQSAQFGAACLAWAGDRVVTHKADPARPRYRNPAEFRHGTTSRSSWTGPGTAPTAVLAPADRDLFYLLCCMEEAGLAACRTTRPAAPLASVATPGVAVPSRLGERRGKHHLEARPSKAGRGGHIAWARAPDPPCPARCGRRPSGDRQPLRQRRRLAAPATTHRPIASRWTGPWLPCQSPPKSASDSKARKTGSRSANDQPGVPMAAHWS